MKGVSLEIKSGEFVVILGPSGSGKSTLLNCISGLERADSGKICYDEKDITILNDKKLTVTKCISLMKVFGYSFVSCKRMILNGYRPIAYIGFVIGTVYQYALIKIMLQLFEATSQEVPEYNFDFVVFAGVLVSFIVVYEIVVYFYSVKIKNISVKEIMLE